MKKVLVITPVKDSWETMQQTIEGLYSSTVDFEYIVYNDFSKKETRQRLIEASEQYGFNLVHLEDVTDSPSPNYKLILQLAQEEAIRMKLPLLIVESDVVVQPTTITELVTFGNRLPKAGMVGAITVDRNGKFNFPYATVKITGKGITETRRSLSFCATLITLPLLKEYNFKALASNKDWFDIHISRQSRRLGFKNYLSRRTPVLHQPHSSRPWKQLKYSNPLKYYWYKLIQKRDRI